MNVLDKKYPEGHFLVMWMGICVALFSGIGIPVSIATNNPGLIGIGPALGVSIGAAVGQSFENRYRREGRMRPLTYEEQRRKDIRLLAGVSVLTVGAVAAFMFVIFYF